MTIKDGKHKSVMLQIGTFERILRRRKVPTETIDGVIQRILDGETDEQKH